MECYPWNDEKKNKTCVALKIHFEKAAAAVCGMNNCRSSSHLETLQKECIFIMPDTELKTYSNSYGNKKCLCNALLAFFRPFLPTSSGVKVHNCVISSLYNRSQDSYQVEYGLVEIKIGITEPFANDNHDGSTMFVHSCYVNAVRSFLNVKQ